MFFVQFLLLDLAYIPGHVHFHINGKENFLAVLDLLGLELEVF
jgi:hypothetical protein